MRRVLIVGVGSSHGDDQAGWYVVRRLREWLLSDHALLSTDRDSVHTLEFDDLSIEIRQAQTPTDLLNWVDGQETLHLIDACENTGEPRTIEIVPETQIALESSWREVLETGRTLGGTHGFDILSVLDLSCHLGIQPERVIFWLVPGDTFEASEELSEGLASAIKRTVHEIVDCLRIRK